MSREFYALPKRDGTPRKFGRYHIERHPDGSETCIRHDKSTPIDLAPVEYLERNGYRRYAE